jgi:hypothetical protein
MQERMIGITSTNPGRTDWNELRNWDSSKALHVQSQVPAARGELRARQVDSQVPALKQVPVDYGLKRGGGPLILGDA